uniref:Putative secreted metalloprotease n=1 Tax=Ixodes ricinus TaxID=34613 RepID=A0A6B0V9Z8_IXORI
MAFFLLRRWVERVKLNPSKHSGRIATPTMVPNALVLLLLASVLTYPLGGDAGPIARRMLSKEKMTAWISVCITYDEIYTRINPYSSDAESFLEYFKAFVKATELRFQDLENTRVILALRRIEKHTGNEALPVIETTSSGTSYVDSDKTILALTKMRETRPNYYQDCDVFLFITGNSVDTHLINHDGTFHGLPLKGRFCEHESVAFIQDNGKTFSGVHSFAQQLAFLQVAGNNFGCWRDVPHSLVYPLPHDYLGTMSSPCGLYKLGKCNGPEQGLQIDGQQVSAPPCKHMCCNQRGRQEVVNWPDGRPCGVSAARRCPSRGGLQKEFSQYMLKSVDISTFHKQ